MHEILNKIIVLPFYRERFSHPVSGHYSLRDRHLWTSSQCKVIILYGVLALSSLKLHFILFCGVRRAILIK